MGFRERLELRRSNATVPHRNRYRERKAGQDGADWLAEWEEEIEVWEPGQLTELDDFIREFDLAEEVEALPDEEEEPGFR
ncbi:hypothetical protein [Mycolicibacterium phlei]|uniref:hypothetical protein n=1 Tax=Mycolicibacterium phlei TaxID=1771 RepID=UPI00058DEF8D|nr:hypothetical protein [Mycolicibacterium phlei]MBF4194621.1 hypothetical protein [Mycolicibacterium phlei]